MQPPVLHVRVVVGGTTPRKAVRLSVAVSVCVCVCLSVCQSRIVVTYHTYHTVCSALANYSSPLLLARKVPVPDPQEASSFFDRAGIQLRPRTSHAMRRVSL